MISIGDDDQYIKIGREGSLSFQILKKQPIHTIDHWTAAFQAFAAVYSERFSSETAQLMKYGATVRDLAELGPTGNFMTNISLCYDKKANSMGPNPQ